MAGFLFYFFYLEFQEARRGAQKAPSIFAITFIANIHAVSVLLEAEMIASHSLKCRCTKKLTR